MRKTVLRPSIAVPLMLNIARWYFSRVSGRGGFPLVCGVFLTNRCNCTCSMCSIWRDRKKADLSLETIKTLVDALTPGLCYLSFSGGEPLLVDGIMEMIAYTARRVPYVHLVSNGLLIDDDRAGALQNAGLTELSLSLDGEREWHSTVRGAPNSFDAVLSAIDSMRRCAPRVEIVVNTVLFPDRPNQAEKAVAITRSLGVKHKIQPVNTHFRFADSVSTPQTVSFSGSDIAAVTAAIGRIRRERHVVNTPAYLETIPEYIAGKLECPMIRPKCLLPEYFAEVSAYGMLSPCMMATGWEGTIPIDENLRSALRSPGYSFAKRALESCRLCDRSMYVCYWEPMMSFPLSNFFKYFFKK
jgi:MoaA/NifB/PqqE/SkfB family radical SAM enzyme